jgi:hypothetical protein
MAVGGRRGELDHPPLTGEAIRNDDTFGMRALTLRPGAFDWQLHPIPGEGGFTDNGSARCH